MHQHRFVTLTAVAALTTLAIVRPQAQGQPMGDPLPPSGPIDVSQPATAPNPYEKSTRIDAYRWPESAGPKVSERVAYIFSEQLPPPSSGRFTLGGCAYEHGRRGRGCPHPWRTGPGWCDDWRVGPHWDASLDGIVLHRRNLQASKLDLAFGESVQRIEQFYYEAGARGYLTGRGIMGYDIQLGYVGVDAWRAYADYFLPVIGNRDTEFRSNFHTAELNFLPISDSDSNWRLLLGIRYAELDEDAYIRDVNINVENSTHVDNKMIGFQLGARRDLWRWGDRWYLEGLINGGVYRNRIKRADMSGTITGGTDIVRQAEENDIAILAEAAFNSVLRINNCVALRAGYQAIVFDGVTKGEDAFIGPGFTTGTVFYHGLQFGVEYRR